MHILSLALGGCITGRPAYGLTEDTGGHITYILGAAEALARRGDVDRVEIVTRRFDDPALGPAYAVPVETLNHKLLIRRVDSGDSAYLAKERLARDRGAFTEALIAELRGRPRLPDLIHAHFADAADVAARVRGALGIPFIYTAHSLGMDKRRNGRAANEALAARIAEEGRAITAADAIVGSSRDECERQLMAYPMAWQERIHCLPPGIELPDESAEQLAAARTAIRPFLRDTGRPMVLAIARPVHKKNLVGLVHAFAGNARLRERANLVILAGLRHSVGAGEAEQVEVMRALVDAIDAHDLHGQVAYPRRHDRAAVHGLYRLASVGGVFVNPAFTEPYGLTLLEAAAHAVPVVATRHGGPADIVAELEHGLLIDPCDVQEIGNAIDRLIDDTRLHARCARNGLERIGAHSWDGYAERFAALARTVRRIAAVPVAAVLARPAPERLLLSDIDNTLTGCARGAALFARHVASRPATLFGVATGRSLPEAQRVLRLWRLPTPELLITSVGSEIYWRDGDKLHADKAFAAHMAANWDAGAVSAALAGLPGLTPQAPVEQRRFKRSFRAASPRVVLEVERRLAQAGIAARVVFSHGDMLDVLPAGGGKGAAMAHAAERLSLPLEAVVAAGDSGNDFAMLRACPNAVLVANCEEGLRAALGGHGHHSRRRHAAGVVEGLRAHERRLAARPVEVAA